MRVERIALKDDGSEIRLDLLAQRQPRTIAQHSLRRSVDAETALVVLGAQKTPTVLYRAMRNGSIVDDLQFAGRAEQAIPRFFNEHFERCLTLEGASGKNVENGDVESAG